MADPTRRISMEEIKTHKWFTRGLPPGALEMNEFLLQGLSTMDDVSFLHYHIFCREKQGFTCLKVAPRSRDLGGFEAMHD